MSLILTKEWLKAAFIDLSSIEYLIEIEHLTSVVAFHSQQSIEKSLKALMVFKDQKIPRIHSLNKLFKLCENSIEISNQDLVNLLDSLYIESRYPGDMGLLPHGNPTIEDAQQFYNFANIIFNQTCKILKIERKDIEQKENMS